MLKHSFCIDVVVVVKKRKCPWLNSLLVVGFYSWTFLMIFTMFGKKLICSAVLEDISEHFYVVTLIFAMSGEY